MPALKSSEQNTCPFAIDDLDHLVLRVHDEEPILAFYCDILGLNVERRLDELGLIQLRAGSALIDIVPISGELGRAGGAPPDLTGSAQGGRNLDHFCLQITPFDETHLRNYLASHGIQTEPAKTRYGAQGFGPSIYLKDPEGNTVELKGPSQPQPAGDS